MPITSEKIGNLFDHFCTIIQAGLHQINSRIHQHEIAEAFLMANILRVEIIDGTIHDQLTQLIKFLEEELSPETLLELNHIRHKYGNGFVRVTSHDVHYHLESPHTHREFDMTAAIRILGAIDTHFHIEGARLENRMTTIMTDHPTALLEPTLETEYRTSFLCILRQHHFNIERILPGFFGNEIENEGAIRETAENEYTDVVARIHEVPQLLGAQAGAAALFAENVMLGV